MALPSRLCQRKLGLVDLSCKIRTFPHHLLSSLPPQKCYPESNVSYILYPAPTRLNITPLHPMFLQLLHSPHRALLLRIFRQEPPLGENPYPQRPDEAIGPRDRFTISRASKQKLHPYVYVYNRLRVMLAVQRPERPLQHCELI